MACADHGSGRPLVLLHGWGMRGAVFKAQVDALCGRFRVIVPDLRGHGDSSRLEAGQGLETLVDDVAELLASMNLSNAILVGWSMGAMVAWGVMHGTEARRISGLVTIDMVPRLLNDDSWKFGLRLGNDASVFAKAVHRMRSDWRGFAKVFVPRIFASGKTDSNKQAIDRMVATVQSGHGDSMAGLWTSMAEQDFCSQLAEIKVPVLVTYGKLSQLYCEAASEWLAAVLPNARRVGFANSGHAPHLEEPDLFNREIEIFIDEIESRDSGQHAEATSESN